MRSVMPLDDMNPRVRLSVQRALLGEITAEMRIITADWTDSLILIRVYHDGPLDHEYRKRWMQH